jgi:hypothetical protein
MRAPIREHRRDRDVAYAVHEPLNLTRLPASVKEARCEGRRFSVRLLDHDLEGFERHITIIAPEIGCSPESESGLHPSRRRLSRTAPERRQTLERRRALFTG